MTHQPLWVILCRLPEKGRREIEIVEEMKERDRGERKINESEGKEEIKTFPLYHYLLQGQQALPNCKPILVGRPGDVRYTTPLPHPTTLFRTLSCWVMSDDDVTLQNLQMVVKLNDSFENMERTKQNLNHFYDMQKLSIHTEFKI